MHKNGIRGLFVESNYHLDNADKDKFRIIIQLDSQEALTSTTKILQEHFKLDQDKK